MSASQLTSSLPFLFLLVSLLFFPFHLIHPLSIISVQGIMEIQKEGKEHSHIAVAYFRNAVNTETSILAVSFHKSLPCIYMYVYIIFRMFA